MREPFTASKHSEFNGKTVSTSPRLPVLEGIFFFDEEDRKENPLFEYSIAELSRKIWMKSFEKFEDELQMIMNYFKSRCNELGIKAEPFHLFQSHMKQLFDLEALHKHQLLILRNVNTQDLSQISHEFKLRLEYDDLNSYIIGRNLVYLTFMSLVQFSRSIGEQNIYLLLILTFLMIYYLGGEFSYFKLTTDAIDYSIYEIARILTKDRRMKFESLVSSGVMIIDKERAEITIGKLLQLLFDETLIDPFELEEKVDEALADMIDRKVTTDGPSTFHRSRIQIMMQAFDSNKINHVPIVKGSEIEFLENIISSKTRPNRFKSDFKISKISAQTTNILLSDKSCVISRLTQTIGKWEQEYHIHYVDNEDNSYKCSLSIIIPITSYLRSIPILNQNGLECKLHLNNYKNLASNIISQSEPGIAQQHFAPKLGISRPRNTPRLVIDNENYIFERNPKLEMQIHKSEGVVEIFNHPDKDASMMREVELLPMLESLMSQDIITVYEFDIFEDEIILFILMNFNQQEKLIAGEIGEKSKAIMAKLIHSSNISIAIIIDQ